MLDKTLEAVLYVEIGKEKDEKVIALGAKLLKNGIMLKIIGLEKKDTKYMSSLPYVSLETETLIHEKEIEEFIEKYKKEMRK